MRRSPPPEITTARALAAAATASAENITISGGTVSANGGGYGCAGIGGGHGGDGGNITISGGAVTATGNNQGAGIGGGHSGSGGTITISDNANVVAKGGSDAAGIGGGYDGDGGNIIISGGAVTATGYSGSAGSGGYNGDGGSAGIGGGKSASGGSITISGDAKVTATGGKDGAGIGGRNGSITISGDAEVTATGGEDGAGIGSGNQAPCGTITISGSAQVTATGGYLGAGIGTGNNSIDNNYGTITISGSAQVTATGGFFGAGVGSGNFGRVGAVTISGGTVFAAGGFCAQDIGHGNGSEKCGLLSISGDDTAVLLKNDSTATITTSSHTRVYKRNTINGQLYGYTMPSASWTSIGAYLPDSRYYILTYDANEGTGIDADAHLPGGGPIIIGSSRISRTCYAFVEWNTSPGGDGTPYAPGDELTMTEDTTVYAIWKEIEVGNVDIRNDTEVLLPDDVVTLTAVVSPKNALDKSLSWTSSDEDVATVDSQGVVTGIGMGTATIKAETSNGVYDTCQIVVSGVLMNYELSTGSVMKMSATVLPSGTTAVWTSDNESVATVDQDGTVTAKAPGYAVITATGGSTLHRCGVVVYDQAVTSVKLSRTSADLVVNDTTQLTAYVFPDDAVNKDVTWTSDNKNVVTVSDSGKVTAVGKGTTTVTAQSGGQSASCTIEVTLPVTIATLDLPAGTLGEGYSCTVTASGGITWYASGLPKGLSIDRDTGKISGKPNETGDFSVYVTVCDGEGRSAEKIYTLTVGAPSETGKYEIVPDADSAYAVSTSGGFTTLTVKDGVTGFRYFKVSVNPIVAHQGEETCVFVHMRKGVQIGFSFLADDFDSDGDAGVGFNVQPGDIIKVYIIDELSNSAGKNPVLLQ